MTNNEVLELFQKNDFESLINWYENTPKHDSSGEIHLEDADGDLVTVTLEDNKLTYLRRSTRTDNDGNDDWVLEITLEK